MLADAGNPFSILTKSTLVLRDLDLLRKARDRAEIGLNISIGTLDTDVWRLLEPGTPPPRGRLEAVRKLNAAGISCGVLIAPVVPGLSDDDEHLEEIARACKDAGATSVHAIALHLRPKIREHCLGFLADGRPDLLKLYRQRFPTGSYQPAEVQRRIAATVAARIRQPVSALGLGNRSRNHRCARRMMRWHSCNSSVRRCPSRQRCEISGCRDRARRAGTSEDSVRFARPALPPRSRSGVAPRQQ